MINIFDIPTKYRKILLEKEWILPEKRKSYGGKSLVCMFLTSFCVVGCPFCFFKSPLPENGVNEKESKNHSFDSACLRSFLEFARRANVGYLQISGGGEPFLKLEYILECVRKVPADRIILVSSGFWAEDKKKAADILDRLYRARIENPQNPRLSIRVSVSRDHSIRLGDRHVVNLIRLFSDGYSKEERFTLQLKHFEDDPTLDQILDKWFHGYLRQEVRANGTDDEKIIKIMPWKYTISLKSGYSFVVGKARVFFPTLQPDLRKASNHDRGIRVYDIDTDQSQDDYPSIAKNGDGTDGLDWIVEYNGNVCTWQNRIPDNQFNVETDTYEEVYERTMRDLVSYSFIDRGASYRDNIIREISPKTVARMKAVNIRDYAGNLAFYDEKIRLYYNIRVLQDYLRDGILEASQIENLPDELKNAVMLGREELKKLYEEGKRSAADQEMQECHTLTELRDFIHLMELDHFELSEDEKKRMKDHFDRLKGKDRIGLYPNQADTKPYRPSPAEANPPSLSGQKGKPAPADLDVERRLTDRIIVRKKKPEEWKDMEFCLFRHGETNWNVKGIIKGQMDDSGTIFTENGLKQLRWAAERISEHAVQAIFSSDLYRTAETAKYINKELQVPLYFSSAFRGLNMGEYQGRSMKEFLHNKEVMTAFSDYDYVIPGGESINQLLERFCGGLKYIRDTFSYDKVLIIAHGAAISNVFSYVNHSSYKDIDYCILRTDGDSFSAVSSGEYERESVLI